MYSRVQINCPALDQIGKRFSEAGDFASAFFAIPAPETGYPRFNRGFQAVVAEVLQSNILEEMFPQLAPLNYVAASSITCLDRYEFEGSLVSRFLEGACAERIVRDEREAREIVQAILETTLLRPKGALCGFRIDDPAWSKLTNTATLSWAYLAYESSHKLWWFVCFADHY